MYEFLYSFKKQTAQIDLKRKYFKTKQVLLNFLLRWKKDSKRSRIKRRFLKK